MKYRLFLAWIASSVRTDVSAWVLIGANLLVPVQAWWGGQPVGTILIVYWLELIVIGFWTCVKLATIDKVKAIGWIPVFLMMYFVFVNLFGVIAGGTLDNEFIGTDFQKNFSPRPYLWGVTTVFLSHAVSFWKNFVRKREFERITMEAQVGLSVMRVFPLFVAAVIGGFVGGFFNSSALLAGVVLPAKILLDLVAHILSHEKIDSGRLAAVHAPQPR